jgi:hypothetical protein
MSEKTLDIILSQISQGRRGFLRALVIGSAIGVLPLMTTQSMAQGEGQDPVNGKCDDGLVVNKKGKCAMPKKKEFRS